MVALDFPAFLDDVTDAFDADGPFDANLPARPAEFVERMRAGEGDAVMGDRCGDAVAALSGELDPETHARSMPRGPIDEFVKTVLGR